MSDPTPETRTSIVLLRLSNTNPSGTLKTPLISIHVDADAEILDCMKTNQLQTKLPRTAATEMKLLSRFDRCVNKVIAAALASGESKTIQGKLEFIESPPRMTRIDAKNQKETSEESAFVFGR